MCFYHNDDDGNAVVSREAVREARKAHSCVECCDGIFPGDRYLENTWLFDGAWGVSRCCLRCQFDIWRIFCREKEEGCRWGERFPRDGELGEALEDAGWVRTLRCEVPDGFGFGWRVAAWAEETRALVDSGKMTRADFLEDY